MPHLQVHFVVVCLLVAKLMPNHLLVFPKTLQIMPSKMVAQVQNIEKEHIVKFLLPEMLEKLSHFIKFLIKKSGMLVVHYHDLIMSRCHHFL
jgi:hypothetical protein